MTARYVLRMLAAYSLMLCAAGCSSPTSPSADPRLRIVNNGPAPANALTVVFPQDQIGFGDVAAGATTVYRSVPNGVYGYAAYRWKVGSTDVGQPVIDWVGAKPMEGRAFTYTIDVDPQRSSQVIRLISVTRDE